MLETVSEVGRSDWNYTAIITRARGRVVVMGYA